MISLTIHQNINSTTRDMKQAQGTRITKTQLLKITKTQFLTTFFSDMELEALALSSDIAALGGTEGQCATTKVSDRRLVMLGTKTVWMLAACFSDGI